ncbi:hypothetical protein ScPMuIL_012842 [Solemya velum]
MAASLKQYRKLLQLLRPFISHRNLSTSPVVSAYWNKDWKAAALPKTPKERAEAAKKYGLRVEDYETYEDDGSGYGDYPKLPIVSGDARDANVDWDIPEMKRNFNEPLHIDADMYGEDRCNPDLKLRYSYTTMLLYLGTFMATVIGVYWWSVKYPRFLPVMPKQYPFNDLYLEKGGSPANEKTIKHYTFEPAD